MDQVLRDRGDDKARALALAWELGVGLCLGLTSFWPRSDG